MSFPLSELSDLLHLQARKGTVIVFDLGRVLVHHDDAIVCRELAKHCPLIADEIDEVLYKGELPELFHTGRITPEAFWRRARARLQLDSDFPEEQFWEIYRMIWHEEPGSTVEIAAALREQNAALALLSNLEAVSHAYLLARHPQVFTPFERRYISHERQVRKPDIAAYSQVEQDHPDAPGFLLVDDLIRNLTMASQRGWATIHFRLPPTL